MTVFRSLVAGLLAAALASAPAVAGPRHGGQPQPGWQERDDGPRGWPQRDSDRVFLDVQQGRAMPLPQLERRVMPLMPGAEYLGPELNRGTYRLKFMQNGRVIWVDVDSQTGRIIRRSR
ncbi:hypothetical protein [Sphingomonas sp.]|uniref:hypothetical protein n=1 Tax=Sphingomonas sp. TaxID=28214 RepID=UPI0025DC8BD6|nr:hypothetical protein [Sphingomonas sp.]MBV9527207.1 hypothetical protein [Sphingomonas sp.]